MSVENWADLERLLFQGDGHVVTWKERIRGWFLKRRSWRTFHDFAKDIEMAQHSFSAELFEAIAPGEIVEFVGNHSITILDANDTIVSDEIIPIVKRADANSRVLGIAGYKQEVLKP
jgi:hypothetical protein